MTDKTAGSETLPAKIARIALEIGQKDPIKHSRDVKFAYHSARDVYGWWKEAIQKESIILIPKVLSVDVQFVEIPKSSGGTRKTFLTTLNVEFTMKNGVTNEYFVGSAVGQGEDPSDKGAGKAMTYAEKAFLLGLGMNGAEMDNEAYSDDDRDYDRRDRRDDRYDDRGRRDVVITDSNIEGIQRGGRSAFATEAQIAAVKSKARDLNIGIRGVAEFIDTVLHTTVQLPDDPQEAPQVLSKALAALSADQIGELIAYMDLSLRQGRSDDSEGSRRDSDGYEGYDGGYGG